MRISNHFTDSWPFLYYLPGRELRRKKKTDLSNENGGYGNSRVAPILATQAQGSAFLSRTHIREPDMGAHAYNPNIGHK